MQVLKITPRGYCHGVVDAFRIAKRVREETQGPVHMLGMLVHNTHATDDLQRQGVALIDQPNRLEGLEHIKEGTVIFTAHGVSPQVKQRAVELGLTPVDATCSDVVRTHELVADLARKGYEVVYIGRKGHPEPEGVMGEAPENIGQHGLAERVRAGRVACRAHRRRGHANLPAGSEPGRDDR